MTGRRGVMTKRKRLTEADGEVRELTAEDFKRFQPATRALPRSLLKKLAVRASSKPAGKERIAIDLSSDVVEHFRAMGPGWRRRMDAALRSWLRAHQDEPRRAVGA